MFLFLFIWIVLSFSFLLIAKIRFFSISCNGKKEINTDSDLDRSMILLKELKREEQAGDNATSVKVKKNATDVTVTGIADGDSFKVGQTVEVTLPRAGVDTDERDLTVDKADNVEIKAGEKARVWSVKFLKAGELTFTAKAFQSTTYSLPSKMF